MKTTEVIQYIAEWLKEYCESTEMNGFVIGISGGIDSAVTSTLCAVSGKAVMMLNMPIYQDPEQVRLAQEHIQWLEEKYANAKGIYLDLTPAFRSLEMIFLPDIQDGLTMANTRARLRMLTLFAYATHHNMLVTGTGNKIEDFGVGFFTKYGDGGVDISPIADLMKTEVYMLARKMGIHEGILNAPPTDGLWADGRTDESQLGATYGELEWAMRFVAEPRDEDKLDVRQKEVLGIYRRFHQANRHKMTPIPSCNIPNSLK